LVERTTNNFRFPGQYFIEETGLYYNWWRWYKNQMGRYLQQDWIEFKGNLYIYSQNNPQMYIDILGLKDCYGEWQRQGWDRVYNVICMCYWLCVPFDTPIIWSGNKYGLDPESGDECACNKPREEKSCREDDNKNKCQE